MTNKLRDNKQLFIIGNGFDRAHNLNTAYADFYYYLSKAVTMSDEQSLFHLLIEQIPLHDKNSDVIWSNFEEFLGDANFDSDIGMTAEYGMDQLDGGADKDVDYYDYQASHQLQDKQLMAETLPSIFTKWISTIDVTKAEVKEGFKRLIKDANEFLTFNYTPTLEELYDVASPCHIHGTFYEDGEKNDIMVGHGHDELERYSYARGDENPLEELSSISAIEECQNRSRGMYNAWRKDVARNLETHRWFFRRIGNVCTIYSYGFSYGSVDMPYIREIIRGLGETEKVRWLLENYDENASARYEARIKDAGFNGVIGRFSV